MAMMFRAAHIRYIGVGTMLLAGVWTLIKLLRPIASSISASLRSLKQVRGSGEALPRTERDIPFHFVLIGTAVAAIAAFLILNDLLRVAQFSGWMHYGLCVFAVIYILIIGFFIAAVCAYLSGLVGMTNNPLSGLMICCVLLASLLLLPVLSTSAVHPEV